MSQDLQTLFAPYTAPRPIGHRAALAFIAALLLTTAAFAGVRASGTALPGELLYPVKRTAEHAALLAADTPAAEATLHLQFARHRLDELDRVRDAHPEAVPRLASAALTELKPLGRTPAATALRHRAHTALAPYAPDLAR
jgi:hypothetical protein